MKVWLPHYEKRQGKLGTRIRRCVLKKNSAATINRLSQQPVPVWKELLCHATGQCVEPADSGAHRAMGCGGVWFYGNRYGFPLRRKFGWGTLLEPDGSRCAYPVDGNASDPQQVARGGSAQDRRSRGEWFAQRERCSFSLLPIHPEVGRSPLNQNRESSSAQKIKKSLELGCNQLFIVRSFYG